VSSNHPLKVLVRGPLNEYSGYGKDTCGIARALTRMGCDVFLEPTYVSAPLTKDIAALLTKHLQAPFDLLIHHSDPDNIGISPAAAQCADVKVAWSMWEFCLTPEHEIFTRRGWLRFDQLHSDDETLGINPETGLSEWQVVERVNTFEGERDMTEFRSNRHSSVSTAEHRWLVKDRSGAWAWRTTDSIRERDGIPRAAVCADLPSEAKYADAFVELVAWAYTEGWLERGRQIRIGQNERVNPENTQRIRAALGVLGRRVLRNSPWPGGDHTWSEGTKADGMVHFNLSQAMSDSLAAVMLDRITLDKVPSHEFLLSMTRAQLEMFIDVSCMADGWQHKGGGRGFGQTAGPRMEAFVYACVLAGKTVSVPAENSVHRHLSSVIVGDHFWTTRPSAQSVVHYKGTVWCPTVRLGNWLARHNGAIFFTGNSDARPLASRTSSFKKRLSPFDLFLMYDQVAVDAWKLYGPKTQAWGVLQGGYESAEWNNYPGRDWFGDRWQFCMNGQLHARKSQPLYSKLLTPDGWKAMGDVRAGDVLVDPEGGTQTVTQVKPRWSGSVYEVEFSDGAKTRCTGDHLWLTDRKHWRAGWQGEWKTRTLSEIMADGLRSYEVRGGNWRYRVPNPVVDFAEKFLPVDPYLVGALCGDGSLSGSSVEFTNIDADCLDEVRAVLPEGVQLVPRRSANDGKSWMLTGQGQPPRACRSCGQVRRHAGRGLCGTCTTRERRAGTLLDWSPTGHPARHSVMRRLLDSAGLGSEVTPCKFVPEQYLRGSAAQRLAVLQGLMDTDGWVSGKGSAAGFGSSSPRLAEAVIWLARSLGGTASAGKPVVRKGGRYPHRNISIVLPPGMSPFRMARKRAGMRAPQQDWMSRRIKAIREVGEETVQCISVSGLSGTYVTDDFAVTHNSPYVSIQAFNELRHEHKEFESARLALHTTIGDPLVVFGDLIPGMKVWHEMWEKPVLEDFYHAAHVLLAPSRGEGKNLPALEMMTTGGAVAVTAWGGHQMWLGEEYAYGLDYTLTPTDARYPDQAHDAKVSVETMKDFMWHSFSNRDEVRRKAELAAEIIPKMCDWSVVIERFFDRVRDLVPGKGEILWNKAQSCRKE
jgi:LAGLIDADG DNA endonuclease family protein